MLAITDHGETLGGRISSVFFERLIGPVPGIKLLKGIEANVCDDKGNSDIPKHLVKYMDIILLGLHNNIQTGLGIETYTDMLCEAIKKNRCIDIITHPIDHSYPINIKKLISVTKPAGIALELNNSKLVLGRVEREEIIQFIKICKSEKSLIAINSDAHTINEIGTDNEARSIVSELKFPSELIINNNQTSTTDFIETRREFK